MDKIIRPDVKISGERTILPARTIFSEDLSITVRRARLLRAVELITERPAVLHRVAREARGIENSLGRGASYRREESTTETAGYMLRSTLLNSGKRVSPSRARAARQIPKIGSEWFTPTVHTPGSATRH